MGHDRIISLLLENGAQKNAVTEVIITQMSATQIANLVGGKGALGRSGRI